MKIATRLSSYRRKACPVLDTGPVSSPNALESSLCWSNGQPHFHTRVRPAPCRRHCYENSHPTPSYRRKKPAPYSIRGRYPVPTPTRYRHTGEKPAPYSIRGRYPVPTPWNPVRAGAVDSPIFIPVCGLRRAIVIPNADCHTCHSERRPPHMSFRTQTATHVIPNADRHTCHSERSEAE